MKQMIMSALMLGMLGTFAANGLAQPLDEKTQHALIAAINDEYRAKALYQKVIEQFGDVRPFSNIIQAEQHHIEELLPLFKKYGIDVPQERELENAPTFSTLQAACEVGVTAEIENAKLYDGFFTFVKEQDILEVFTALRDTSQNKHLPTFERCAGRSGGQGNGQGKGSKK